MSRLGKSTSSSSDEEAELRRGPWTLEEDTLLTRYISSHGEGHWNLLAKRSGLRRTGKSCRLRWLNYLKPDVKRGNLTPREQLLILELHCKWGNRWSRIAQHLPGRTDNEIKNYWRTRVQKQARHLNIDSNSATFQELIRGFWMPRLLQKIQEGGSSSPSVGALSQNLTTSLQPPPINHHSPPPPPPPQVGANEIANSPSISSSVSMSNITYVNPQISEYLTSPLQAMVDNSDHYNSTFLKGNCYNVENAGYDMEMFSSSSASIVEAPGDFVDSISGCNIVTDSNWITGNYNLGDGLWNMDESWQLSN